MDYITTFLLIIAVGMTAIAGGMDMNKKNRIGGVISKEHLWHDSLFLLGLIILFSIK